MSLLDSNQTPLGSQEFKNEQERHQAILLAIEAFLTYRSRLPRRETIHGLYRVEYDGKEYRMSDFDAPKT